MVIIKFTSGTDWYKANWVFRQIVNDVIAQSPDDVEVSFIMKQGQSYGLLSLDKLDSTVASKVVQAIRKVAEETLAGNIPGWKGTKPDDAKGQQMYLRSIAELLDLIKKDAGEAQPRTKP
jgi:hypothetical protein